MIAHSNFNFYLEKNKTESNVFHNISLIVLSQERFPSKDLLSTASNEYSSARYAMKWIEVQRTTFCQISKQKARLTQIFMAKVLVFSATNKQKLHLFKWQRKCRNRCKVFFCCLFLIFIVVKKKNKAEFSEWGVTVLKKSHI